MEKNLKTISYILAAIFIAYMAIKVYKVEKQVDSLMDQINTKCMKK